MSGRSPDPIEEMAVGPGDKVLPSVEGLTVGAVGRQNWNVLRGDLLLPAMVLRESALANNIETMHRWCDEHGVSIAPHGKTTMAPQLFKRQIEAGAWAITAATVAQARVMRWAGVRRVLVANEVVDPAGVAWIGQELASDAEAWIACLVDSLAGVGALARHGGARPLPVLVELGVAGGRTGCRSRADALAVAEAVAASPALALTGVEAFEGVLHEPDDGPHVDAFLMELRALAEDLAGRGLFEGDEAVVSAGGSIWFDRVVEAMRGIDFGMPTRVVVRSGCYLTHDSGLYARLSPLSAQLQAAINVWAVVLSRPERGLALVGMGKRDVAHDIDLPVPQSVVRDGEARPARDITVFDLNDQHAFMRVPEDDPLAPGDLVSFGISHPCTAFDKWRLIPVVDDEGNVIDAVRTFF